MSKRIDLHIHTNVSDGALTPKEVIDEAAKNNVSIIAIADHDTIDAYNDGLFAYAKSKNVQLINAVEISTKIAKAGIHVLGYKFNLNDQEFKNSLYKLRNARHIYLHEVAEKLNELGYYLNVEELDKVEAVTKAHIALDVINSEKNEKKLLEVFGHIPNKGEFIETIMNENCPAYVEKEICTPKEAAELIRRANGKVVLAHPVAYAHEDNLTEDDIQKIVNDMKPDGIEANYLYVDRNDQKFDETEKWNKFAKDNNLFVTIGSDFHDKDGLRPEIGFTNTSFKLADEVIDEIIANICK
ncbi:MAG TPA: PHP domain-containing protein [Clostridiaceae bacterium]|nr:PHP domain-containing protein [Clostridiaceae bacterium]